MDIKEKLVGLINDCRFMEGYGMDLVERQADHLIAHGVTVQEWISVEDRLPRTNVGVLVYAPRLKNIFEAFYRADGKWEIFSYRAGEILNDKVTHWMPLPESPKEDE